MTLRIFGDSISGNCLKVKWTADRLGLKYEWIETSAISGETRSPAFLAINPVGQVPAVILSSGKILAQSNAIICHLAEGSPLIPADAYERARMLEWMFWEQYSHEPYVAVARFQLKYLGRPVTDLDPKLVERGCEALARLDSALEGRAFLVSEALSLADIALVAYSRMAGDGGFDLQPLTATRAWIGRVEHELSLSAL